MSAIEQLQEFRKQRDELKKKLEETSKSLFKEASSDLFEQHPGLISFSWTQYTPYWNDGDTCEFSAQTDYISVKYSGDTEPDEDDYDEETEYGINGFYDHDWNVKPPTKTLRADLTEKDFAIKSALEFLLNFEEDDFKEMFGDHVRIIVTRDGVEVEDYTDHD